MEWFLYDSDLRHGRVKSTGSIKGWIYRTSLLSAFYKNQIMGPLNRAFTVLKIIITELRFLN